MNVYFIVFLKLNFFNWFFICILLCQLESMTFILYIYNVFKVVFLFFKGDFNGNLSSEN